MITRIVIVILIAGVVYLNYTNPTEQEHREAILAQLEQDWPVSEEMQAALWRNVDYSNFMVCSFLKTTLDSKMISTGYLKKVKIVNDKWLAKAAQNLQKQLNY